MYQFIRTLSANDLLKHQLPTFTTSFLIAEFFYKFHSFALECIAFLATWFVLDLFAHGIVARFARRETTHGTTESGMPVLAGDSFDST
jgi:hypothetical protein